MLSHLKIGFKYLKYFFTSSNGKGHGIHSHFIFNLVKKVFNDNHKYVEFEKIENLRKQLINDVSTILVEDFGAGSFSTKSDSRSISSIAKWTAKPAKFGQLFFRLTNHFKPKNILELGTSLGFSTAYFAVANKNNKVVSLEGSLTIAQKAKENFEKLEIDNIQIVSGNFDDTLLTVLKENEKFDFIFFDGNHRKAPTLKYFEQCLNYTDSDALFIFDDIHWSNEMEEAWEEIKAHPSVTCSIDLFFIGLIFFRKEFKEVQHLSIRY